MKKNTTDNDTTYEVTKNLKGDTIFITPFVNGKANGQFRSYYDNGQLWSVNNYVNDELEGQETIYTENGAIAEINRWENSRMKDQKIYWQAIPYTNDEKHYFLSDTGVYKIKNSYHVYNMDSHPPQGFIIEKHENGKPIYYVYKNDRFEKYPVHGESK